MWSISEAADFHRVVQEAETFVALKLKFGRMFSFSCLRPKEWASLHSCCVHVTPVVIKGENVKHDRRVRGETQVHSVSPPKFHFLSAASERPPGWKNLSTHTERLHWWRRGVWPGGAVSTLSVPVCYFSKSIIMKMYFKYSTDGLSCTCINCCNLVLNKTYFINSCSVK